jgi:hypothetical protein
MPRPGSAMADAESVAAAEIAMASLSRPETPSVGQQIWRPDYGRRRDTAGGGHVELLPRGHAGHDWRRHVPETEHHLTEHRSRHVSPHQGRTSSHASSKVRPDRRHYVGRRSPANAQPLTIAPLPSGASSTCSRIALETATDDVTANVLYPTRVATPMALNDFGYAVFCSELEHPTLDEALPRMPSVNPMGGATGGAGGGGTCRPVPGHRPPIPVARSSRSTLQCRKRV